MDAYIGTILPWPMSWAPTNWAMCQGQLLAISQNTPLFSLLGTTYGGNGVSTFGLPNLQGRVMVGYGNGLGLTPREMGEMAGTETVSLLVSNLPSHNHPATFTPSGGGSLSLMASPNAGNSSTPAGNYIANGTDPGGTVPNPIQNYVTPAAAGTTGAVAGFSGSGGGGSVTVGMTGQNIPVGIMPPFLVVNFIICLQGIFPSRS